jgi:hypothetical protein
VKIFYCSWPRVIRCGSATAYLTTEIVGLIPAESMDVLFAMRSMCYWVDASASGRSLFQRSSTVCGVSECDCEAPIMKRPLPSSGCCAIEKRSTVLTCNNAQFIL